MQMVMGIFVPFISSNVFPCTCSPYCLTGIVQKCGHEFSLLATTVLGFNANIYTGLTSDEDRYDSLSLLRRGGTSWSPLRNIQMTHL